MEKKCGWFLVFLVPVLIGLLGVPGLAFARNGGHSAEREALFDGGEPEIGFQYGPVMKYTSMYHEKACLVGVRGGFTFDRSFMVGAGGYGLVTDVRAPGSVRGIFANDNMEMEMAYGGVEMEYRFEPNRITHLSVSALAGIGSIGYGDNGASTDKGDFRKKDSVFVFEPGVSGSLHVTRWFGISAGISWRVVNDLQLAGVDQKDMSGFAGNLAFLFGK